MLDRTNGKFLLATPFVKNLNWAKGLDETGRPIRTSIEPSAEGMRVCPGYSGATNWHSPSYSPLTNLFYFLSLEECSVYLRKPQPFIEGRTYYSTGVRHSVSDQSHKSLLAFQLDSGQLAWKYPQVGSGRSSGGTMTTAGGLAFFGDDAESFEAVDAATGTALWHFHTGQMMNASPMSFALGGRQYVAIASGSDVFAFALP